MSQEIVCPTSPQRAQTSVLSALPLDLELTWNQFSFSRVAGHQFPPLYLISIIPQSYFHKTHVKEILSLVENKNCFSSFTIQEII